MGRADQASLERIIPALAGNTLMRRPPSIVQGDHPRSRGEYRPPRAQSCRRYGSSPLSRGIPSQLFNRHFPSRIIPALAGNTTAATTPQFPRTDHPRSRGEYDQFIILPLTRTGSSPLSRGIRQAWTGPKRPIGIIPALAGNTMVQLDVWQTWGDHPRSRGEYYQSEMVPAKDTGSSPLSRGIRAGAVVGFNHTGIIPALAGNTHGAKRHPIIVPDHPRSRGEYADGADSECCPEGSSPLSRGIRSITGWERLSGRIIPALAGNTCSQVLISL